MNSDKYSFDTHALVWYFEGKSTLSSKARFILDDAFTDKNTPFVSVMVLIEALHISFKNKNFIFSKFLKFLSKARFVIVPLNNEVLKESFKLSKEINIHDRVIMATAKVTNSLLVTKDAVSRKNNPNETIW